MIQRNLLSVWLMKGLRAAIIVIHRIIFSWFCLKLIFTWRGITFVSPVLSWQRMFVLAVSEQKGWRWLFHIQFKKSNTFFIWNSRGMYWNILFKLNSLKSEVSDLNELLVTTGCFLIMPKCPKNLNLQFKSPFLRDEKHYFLIGCSFSQQSIWFTLSLI